VADEIGVDQNGVCETTGVISAVGKGQGFHPTQVPVEFGKNSSYS